MAVHVEMWRVAAEAAAADADAASAARPALKAAQQSLMRLGQWLPHCFFCLRDSVGVRSTPVCIHGGYHHFLLPYCRHCRLRFGRYCPNGRLHEAVLPTPPIPTPVRVRYCVYCGTKEAGANDFCDVIKGQHAFTIPKRTFQHTHIHHSSTLNKRSPRPRKRPTATICAASPRREHPPQRLLP